jgi:hypothetical protein
MERDVNGQFGVQRDDYPSLTLPLPFRRTVISHFSSLTDGSIRGRFRVQNCLD